MNKQKKKDKHKMFLNIKQVVVRRTHSQLEAERKTNEHIADQLTKSLYVPNITFDFDQFQHHIE